MPAAPASGQNSSGTLVVKSRPSRPGVPGTTPAGSVVHSLAAAQLGHRSVTKSTLQRWPRAAADNAAARENPAS